MAIEPKIIAGRKVGTGGVVTEEEDGEGEADPKVVEVGPIRHPRQVILSKKEILKSRRIRI